MARFKIRISNVVIIFLIIFLTFVIISDNNAENILSSISGRVLDENGQGVPDLLIAIKPVKFGPHISLKQRTPFPIWLRTLTDMDGNFTIKNIDPVSSQLTLFPEHGSDFELQSIEIGDLTFYSIAFRRAMPTWFGKLTFSIEPGEHLENVIVNIKTPRMRIRGRVLYEDGTPLMNEEISLSISSRSTQIREGGITTTSSGTLGRNFETDNEGYFVTYSQDEAANYKISMTYKGFTLQSDTIVLGEGERHDELVFILKNTKKTKKRESVWVVNPANGNAYKKIQCYSYKDAKSKAESENAYLVAINDEAEQKWLQGLYKNRAFFWIGLHVPVNDAPWQWDSGQPLTYTNWRKGQKPDNITTNSGMAGIAMEFSSKKWMAIGQNSPFSRAVKQAIIEKDKENITVPDVKK